MTTNSFVLSRTPVEFETHIVSLDVPTHNDSSVTYISIQLRMSDLSKQITRNATLIKLKNTSNTNIAADLPSTWTIFVFTVFWVAQALRYQDCDHTGCDDVQSGMWLPTFWTYYLACATLRKYIKYKKRPAIHFLPTGDVNSPAWR
jgi:hypothetical protein